MQESHNVETVEVFIGAETMAQETFADKWCDVLINVMICLLLDKYVPKEQPL